MKTWKEEVYQLLINLGGHAYLEDIYKEFLRARTRPLVKHYQSSIRDALEKGSIESKRYDGKGRIFYMVDGINKGHYGLFGYENIEIDYSQDDDGFSEGKLLLKKHLKRERNQYLITLAKKRFFEAHGKLYCEICGFDFKEKYGLLGEGFIEAHHMKPVSMMQENEKTKVEDIVMVCSNCHSMLHRRKPWLLKEELESIINH